MKMGKLEAQKFAEDWVSAWNRRDLDSVLSHYSDDFEFVSPMVAALAGEPSGRLRGKSAVRAYWNIGLSKLPDLHFTLVDVLAGVNSLTVLYHGHRGLTAEVFEFDATGQVSRGSAMYPAQ